MGGPGGCKSSDECKVYCTDPLHIEECITFASAHGGISKENAMQKLHDFTQKQFEQRGEFKPDEELHLEEEDFRKHFEDTFRKESENFQRKMEERKRQSPKEFPGQGIESFPGKAGGGFPPRNNDEMMKKQFEHRQEFMKKEFENQQERQKRINEFHGRPEGFQPLEDRDANDIFEGLGPKEGTPGIFSPFNQKPVEFTPPDGSQLPPQEFLPPPTTSSVAPTPFPISEPSLLIQ